MKNKKLIKTILCILTISLLLIGCSKGDNTDTSSNVTTTEESPEKEDKTQEDTFNFEETNGIYEINFRDIIKKDDIKKLDGKKVKIIGFIKDNYVSAGNIFRKHGWENYVSSIFLASNSGANYIDSPYGLCNVTGIFKLESKNTNNETVDYYIDYDNISPLTESEIIDGGFDNADAFNKYSSICNKDSVVDTLNEISLLFHDLSFYITYPEDKNIPNEISLDPIDKFEKLIGKDADSDICFSLVELRDTVLTVNKLISQKKYKEANDYANKFYSSEGAIGLNNLNTFYNQPSIIEGNTPYPDKKILLDLIKSAFICKDFNSDNPSTWVIEYGEIQDFVIIDRNTDANKDIIHANITLCGASDNKTISGPLEITYTLQNNMYWQLTSVKSKDNTPFE